jgi:hypothetical protein
MKFEPRISRHTVQITERGTLCDCMLTAIRLRHRADRNVEHTDALCLELPSLTSISGGCNPTVRFIGLQT